MKYSYMSSYTAIEIDCNNTKGMRTARQDISS